MQMLHTLSLGWCHQLQDGELIHLSTLTNLSSLDISRTKASDEGVRSLLPLSNLTNLALAGCPISNHGVGVLAPALSNLITLNLEWCAVGDAGFQSLTSLANLSELNAGYSLIGQRGLMALGGLSGLESLNLDSCDHVTDQGAVSLRLLLHLKRLGRKAKPFTLKQAFESTLGRLNPNACIISVTAFSRQFT